MNLLFILFSMPVLTGVLLPAKSLPTAHSAPPLRHGESKNNRDLGLWDDVIVCRDQDIVVVRRESDLFSLSITASAEPSKLVSEPALAGTKIVACANSDGRVWLFIQSSQRLPFALDAMSGKMVEFKIAGLSVPGSHSPEIQSHVIIPQADAVFLMIAGGDRHSWPRDGNRPLYFWLSMKTGEVVALPTGWDLDYFAADQRLAVFNLSLAETPECRTLQAVDAKTGEFVTDAPDRQHVNVVPFDWTDHQEVKPLYRRRPETNAREYFAGISVNGSVLQFDLGLDGISYMSAGKAKDGFAGFCLHQEGATRLDPGSFWVTSLSQGQKPEVVATPVTDFVMLGGGNCVFSIGSEAFFRGVNDKLLWNVLDQVDRLPELEKEFADKPYIEDRMSVRLIEGFGGTRHNSLAFCLFTQFRGDMRCSVFPMEEKSLKRTTWGRGILLTTDGQRYMTDLFRDGSMPHQIWLHNSGAVIIGRYVWDSTGPRGTRKIQLSETSVQLQGGGDK